MFDVVVVVDDYGEPLPSTASQNRVQEVVVVVVTLGETKKEKKKKQYINLPQKQLKINQSIRANEYKKK